MNHIAQLPAKEAFQSSFKGKATDLFYLTNSNGVQAAITNYGARWVSLLTPDKNGKLVDVLVGYDSLSGFLNASSESYYGATVGRFANRIAKGKFSIGKKEYTLAVNNGPNHLHGGPDGFHNVVWDAEQLNEATLLLTYHSPDGEEGFPGNLDVELTYTLTNNNELHIAFKAVTDQTTIVNLTNHAYFNLNGAGNGDILGHTLEINADYYTPIDETSIPSGVLEPVNGGPFDFRKPKTTGADINEDHIQLQNGIGYDHNFVLNKTAGESLSFAASAIGDTSGIKMEVFTKEPGIQFYSGNFMNGSNRIKKNQPDAHRTGFCLETQHFPDSPNHPSFPSVLLQPEDVYTTETVFKFGLV
jgi:aldose 1-epimerase